MMGPDKTQMSEALTVKDIRTAVSGMLPPAADGTEVVYYAMLGAALGLLLMIIRRRKERA